MGRRIIVEIKIAPARKKVWFQIFKRFSFALQKPWMGAADA